MEKFFSDIENGLPPQINTEISADVFNGIISIYYKYTKSMSFSFPATCPDDNSVIGFNEYLFVMKLKSIIPNFPLSYDSINFMNYNSVVDIYALLDFIELCISNICDYSEDKVHEFFNHNHLKKLSSCKNKNDFSNEINQIFERNGLAYKLVNNSSIKRVLPIELENLIKNYIPKGKDPELNKLIDIAIKYISLPKYENKQIALEKIWDAFERIKTYISIDKKESTKNLLKKVAGGKEEFFKLLDNEALLLTTIGNDFRVRHHETNKIKIETIDHIDYLFYRMMAFISLLINYL